MTLEEMIKTFDECDRFMSKRHWELTDLDGFIRLKELGWKNPGSVVDGIQSQKDLISSAEHDQIWLSVDIEWFISVVTKEDIEYLHDCGIWYDADFEALSLFV